MKRNVEPAIGMAMLVGLSVFASIGCDDGETASSDVAGQEMAPPAGLPAGPPASSSPPAGAGPGPAPGPATPAAPACAIDTRALFVSNGKIVETITSGGRLFNFESNGAGWQTNGIDLTDVQGYATGPCRGRARGQCAFDTRTFVPVGNTLVESITAYGSYWTFDSAGEATSTDLALLPRYRNGGPCDGRAPGQCRFETRTFLLEGSEVVEAVTAYGKSYRYKLDGTALAGNGADLTTIPRYAAGPCAGAAPGQCVFRTRVFEEVDGHVLETITANGKVYRYAASGAAAAAEVQPSNVALDGIEPWASGVCKK